MTMKIKTFGPVDERSLKQLERCMDAGDAEYGVLCADHHPGYSQPIGGAIAYEGYVSPSGVGYDIGCGNKAACTELTRSPTSTRSAASSGSCARSRGGSRSAWASPPRSAADHPVLDKIAAAEFEPQRKLAQNAANQLGTVGSGNHYVNLMEDEQGRIWVGVHFGSRGFGHKTASGIPRARAGTAVRRPGAAEGEMDSPPVLLELGTELGDSYIAAMQLAGEYAYAGRDVVVAKVLEILGADAIHEVHNHHNFAWREEHGGRTYWVIRKGCTPARPGQEGFVGGSMGDDSVILEGVESDEADGVAVLDGARRRPRDEPHPGRRPGPPAQALGVRAPRLRPACSRSTASAHQPRSKRGVCPDHPDSRVHEGVDRGAAQARARSTGPPSRHACASRGSSWSAAARTRRRRCTSASRTCSTRTPARSASSTRCARSAWRWPDATCTTRTRTEGPPDGGPSAVPAHPRAAREQLDDATLWRGGC